MTWRNRYYALRHGESEANLADRIVSQPVTGLLRYGLTPRGRAQVSAIAESIRQWPAGSWDLYASDFARTRQTAERLLDEAGGPGPILFAPELRERDFGSLEGQPTRHYAQVWDADASGQALPPGVETAEAVQKRSLRLVRRLDARFAGRRILLVSHGDVLQILATAFLGLDPAKHRQMPSLGVAELRELTLPT